MKQNPKKVSLAKSKSVISQRYDTDLEIPIDDPDSLNLYLKEKQNIIKQKKKKL